MQILTPKIQSFWIIWIHQHGCIPVKTKMYSLGMYRLYRCIFMGFGIKPRYISSLPHSIAFPWFSGNWSHIKAVTKQYFLPFPIGNSATFPMIAWTYPTTVILQPPINIIGNFVIYVDMIKLSHWNILSKSPRITAIIRNIQPAIVTIDNIGWVIWVNKKRMMIRMNRPPIR